MLQQPTNTVSLLMNTFFTDTVPTNAGPANPLEQSSTQVPISPELLDMPNVIPEIDEAEDYFYWDDVAG